MAFMALTVPVLPGMSDQLRALAKTMLGARRAEFEEAQRSGKITRESWFLDETEHGPRMIICLEADDIEFQFRNFAESTTDFDIWEKGQLQAITGVDVNQPESWPLPELGMRYEQS
jgi:hypothetical protein